MELDILGSRVRGPGLGFRVHCLGFRVQVPGPRIETHCPSRVRVFGNVTSSWHTSRRWAQAALPCLMATANQGYGNLGII